MSEQRIRIVPVETPRELRRFIKFNYRLYRNSPYAVPELFFDLKNTLTREKNPSFDFCEAQCFLAYRDGRIAGRVAAIINHKANDHWNKRAVRFGWIDFIEDIDVARSLLDAVAQWGGERGMDKIEGPLGFTDFDREGMLVYGFDQLGTMSTIYNYEYYPKFMQELGYVKETGWVEFKFAPPASVPEKAIRVAEMVKKRYNLHSVREKNLRSLVKQYGYAIFDLLNEAYKDLFGFSELTKKQIDKYIGLYLTFVNIDLVSLVADADDRLVGVGVSMPSLARALQKSHGRLLPLGWFYLLKALYLKNGTEGVDLLLIGVAKEWTNKGIPAIMMADLVPTYIRMGYKWGESSCELEDNTRVQAIWEPYDHTLHKRRYIFVKQIDKQK